MLTNSALHKEPGYIESEIARCSTAKVLKKILGDKKSGPPMMPKENPFGIFPGVEISLPPWLSEEDINYYRALDLNVSRNSFSQPIGDVFGSSDGIATLDLSFNNFSGDLLNSFSSLSNLSSLYVQNNQLSGSLNVLTSLPLTNLNVANNNFTGWIPHELISIPCFTELLAYLDQLFRPKT